MILRVRIHLESKIQNKTLHGSAHKALKGMILVSQVTQVRHDLLKTKALYRWTYAVEMDDFSAGKRQHQKKKNNKTILPII